MSLATSQRLHCCLPCKWAELRQTAAQEQQTRECMGLVIIIIITCMSRAGASSGFHEVLAMFSYFHAALRPKLWGWRSASRVHSQVWRGRPAGRLQSSDWCFQCSSDVKWRRSILATTCPKNRSRLVWMSWDSCGGEPARSRTYGGMLIRLTSFWMSWACRLQVTAGRMQHQQRQPQQQQA